MKRPLPLLSAILGGCLVCAQPALSESADSKTPAAAPKPAIGPLRTPGSLSVPGTMLNDRNGWRKGSDGKLQAPLRKSPRKTAAPLPDLKPEESLINVNGDVLTWGAAKRYADLLTANFRLPPGVTVEDFEAEKNNISRRYVLTIAEHYISKVVLAQEARKHNLSLTAAEVDAKKKEMVERIVKDRQHPDAFLKELETPGSFMLIDLTNMLMSAKLASEVIRPSLQVSDADVAQYIAERVAKNKESEAYNAGLRPKLEGLLKQLKEGTNFADIAFTQSDCNSSYEGGDWGTFKRGDIRPEITDVAFKMEEGALSDIVETPYSYHILKLIKKNLGFAPDGSKEPAPVISVKIAHIMLERKELLPTLDSATAKAELLAKREKDELAQLKERLIKAAKIVTPLPLY